MKIIQHIIVLTCVLFSGLFFSLCRATTNIVQTCTAEGQLCSCPGGPECAGLCEKKRVRGGIGLQCNCNLNTLDDEEFKDFAQKYDGKYPTDEQCGKRPPFGFDDQIITELTHKFVDLLNKNALFTQPITDKNLVIKALQGTRNKIIDELNLLYNLELKKRGKDPELLMHLLRIYESDNAAGKCADHFKHILQLQLSALNMPHLLLSPAAEQILIDICYANVLRTNLDPCFCGDMKGRSQFSRKPGICRVNKCAKEMKLQCQCN